MDAPPLIIGLPLVPISIGGSPARSIESNPAESRCATASSSCLLSWSLNPLGRTGHALAMGCEDGSTYVFWPYTPQSPPPSSTAIRSPRPVTTTSPPPPRALKSPSPTPSRTSNRSSTLHSGSHVPSLVAPRSLLSTSGVSKAQVEAPKTFVDYDDEPDNLRSMLKTNRTDGSGRSRYRSTSDKISASTDSRAGSPATVVEEALTPSIADSPTLTIQDLSSLPSGPVRSNTTRDDASPLELRWQLFPPRVGFGHAVAALKVLEGGSILACLQESGCLTLFAVSDGRCLASTRIDELPRIRPPSGCKVVPAAQGFYRWKGMRVAQDGQSTLLFIAGQDAAVPVVSNQDLPLPCPDLRVTVLRIRSPHERAFTSSPEDMIEKVGDWISDGVASCVGLHLDSRGDLSLYRLSSSRHLVLQTISFLPHPPSPSNATQELHPGNGSSSFLPLAISQSITELQHQFKLPNPFKPSSRRRSVSHRFSRSISYLSPPLQTLAEEKLECGRIELGDEINLGRVEGSDVTEFQGMGLTAFGPNVLGCAWTEDQCVVFRLGAQREPLHGMAELSADGIRAAVFLDPYTVAVTTMDGVRVFCLRSVDANNDEVKAGSRFSDLGVIHRAEQVFTASCDNISHSILVSPTQMIVSCRDPSDNTLCITNISLRSLGNEDILASFKRSVDRNNRTLRTRTIWKPKTQDTAVQSPASDVRFAIHSVLPLANDTVVLGLSDGTIAKAPMDELLVQRHIPFSDGSKSAKGLVGPVLSLDHCRNRRTGERFVIGSCFDGSVAIWNLSDLQLRARWTLFATPLLSVIDLTDEENVGRLKDCLLCVAQHGTIAVIVIEELQLLYLIPGSSSPLERICLGEDNLLLIYADGKARLWDIKSQEIWRSMTRDKADVLLEQGGWFEALVEQDGPRFPAESSSFGYLRNISGGTRSIFVDIAQLIRTALASNTVTTPEHDNWGHSPKAPGHDESQTSAMVNAWKYLHPMLAGLLTIPLDPDFEELCLSLLGTSPLTQVPQWSLAGFRGAVSFPAISADLRAWKNSQEYSGAILLASVALLRAASTFEEWDSLASRISIYLVSSLPEIIGEGYRIPSLEFLTGHWFDPCAEIKYAARSLFAATVQRLSEKQACDMVEQWRPRLPSVQPDDLKEAPYAAIALIIVGHVVVDHQASIPAEILTDIAKSVALYLHDECSPHRVLAIELCSTGFQVWQHYIDAVTVLRALFTLATTSRKDTSVTGGGSGGVGLQARAAVLQIASTNTPLFMTTLTMDITNPGSVEHRKSIMQLVAFIIRKKPLVLYPNLTRLVEAVIKSLDPNSGSSREVVFDPAIEILGHVVRTFPTVDFHKGTQRLALGTNEGAVIMYDLKTATRLYVLEGHKKRTTAVSFSSDGRRLVTASLDESVVMVWKVGSSLSSFFNPGAPPRQGGAGTDAYKVLPFNVGDEAHMTVASTLDWVAFEWPNERTARLKIRDSVLTFNTT